jgi:hypothetical protein
MKSRARTLLARLGAFPRQCSTLPGRQGGAVSLLVVLVLLMALTLIVLAMGQVGVKEQIISGNDQRTRKVYDAADAGLEYGMAWLAENYSGTSSSLPYGNSWSNGGETQPHGISDISTVFLASATSEGLLIPNDMTPGTGEQYEVRVVIDDDVTSASGDKYIRVTSYARDFNDNSVNTAVEQLAAKTSNGTPGKGDSPPLVMNGCYNNKTTGTPDIYPSTEGDYAGDAILAGDNAKACNDCQPADPGYLDCAAPDDGTDPAGMCTCTTNPDNHLDFQNGDVTASDDNDGNGPDQAGLDHTDSDAAWDFLFPNFSKEEFKNRAAYERDLMNQGAMLKEERTYIFIAAANTDPRAETAADWGVSSGSTWNVNLGSGTLPGNYTPSKPCGTPGHPGYTQPEPTHTVILFFDDTDGCRKLNNNVVIWGAVYFESCVGSGEGFGGGQVYGTVAVDSNMDTLNSAFHICGTSSAGAISDDDKTNSVLVRVSGTWRQL